MGVTASPWLKANGVYAVILSLVIEYFVVCGLTSFYLGSGVLVLSSALLLLQALLGSELLDRRHPSTPWLLLLWLVTAVAATLIGGRNYHASFATYMTAKAGRRYAEVPVAAPASAYADAGVISFASGAAMDAARSVGLRVYGNTYCVAPIVSQDNSTVNVQFWAVGLNCCASRGRFDCDGAGDAAARGGVAVQGPQEGEEAASRSILAPRIFHEGYKRAIAASCSLYQLQSAEAPVLLRWVSSPDAVLIPWLVRALLVWLGSSALYCILAAVVWRTVSSRKGITASRSGRTSALPTSAVPEEGF